MFKRFTNWFWFKLWNFWESKIMEIILLPWTWITTEFFTFYCYFFSLNYKGRILLLTGLILPILSHFRLKTIIRNSRKKDKLAKDLNAFMQKLGPLHQFELNDGNTNFIEAISILENSGVISEADLYYFKEGRLPPQTFSAASLGQVRFVMLQSFIDWAMLKAR